MVKTAYVDTSVLLRIIKGESPAALSWFRNLSDAFLISSSLLKLETRRVAHRDSLAREEIENWLAQFATVNIDDKLLDEAAALEPVLRAADAIHVASAVRLVNAGLDVGLATHDKQMALAAVQLGLRAIDPVTDDPNRGPVI